LGQEKNTCPAFRSNVIATLQSLRCKNSITAAIGAILEAAVLCSEQINSNEF